jgi:DNA-binding NtrC family response regulator
MRANGDGNPSVVDMDTSAPPARILVVDDEPLTARAIERMARHFGHEVVVAQTLGEAMSRLDETPFDVVLTDLHLGGDDGFDLLRQVTSSRPDVPVVMITGYATMDSAMEAIQAGAYDYLAKPPSLESLGELLRRAIEKRRASHALIVPEPETNDVAGAFANIAGRSPQMLDVFKTVARIAPGRANVLILGESGTGKELVARALHLRSPRAERRFVPVNVSAIPEGLLETELFGHIRGAFTGATTTRRGLFEEAHQGTLFLDEIGDLSPLLQAKLLRALQEHTIKPVGGNEEISVDVRLVAATHQNLEMLVQSGRFREDLYYRLNVVSVLLPPLRERVDDIPLLVGHFMRKYCAEYGQPTKRFSPESELLLGAYGWPGNVRELANVVERAIVLSTSTWITPDSLPERIQRDSDAAGSDAQPLMPLDQLIDRHVARVLQHTGGNHTQAARILGISRRTLHRMAARKRAGSDRDTSTQQGTS